MKKPLPKLFQGFTLLELVVAMVLITVAIVPLIGVLPNNARQQVINDRKDRALIVATAAADHLGTFFTNPETFSGSVPTSAPLRSYASGYYSFCDPELDAICRPADCLVGTDCLPPKTIWNYDVVNYLNDPYLKRFTVNICIDTNSDEDCQESDEFILAITKVVAQRCPNQLGLGCP